MFFGCKMLVTNKATHCTCQNRKRLLQKLAVISKRMLWHCICRRLRHRRNARQEDAYLGLQQYPSIFNEQIPDRAVCNACTVITFSFKITSIRILEFVHTVFGYLRIILEIFLLVIPRALHVHVILVIVALVIFPAGRIRWLRLFVL